MPNFLRSTLIISYNIRLVHLNGFFYSDFTKNTLQAFVTSLIHATCPSPFYLPTQFGLSNCEHSNAIVFGLVFFMSLPQAAISVLNYLCTERSTFMFLYYTVLVKTTLFYNSQLLIFYLKNAAFRDVVPCGSCKNRRLGGTSVLTRSTRRRILEDVILYSPRRENPKSYVILY
jgi:hypothetical protein